MEACYLEKEDDALCDQETGEGIFFPVPSVKAQDRLDYRKQKRLNFYADE